MSIWRHDPYSATTKRAVKLRVEAANEACIAKYAEDQVRRWIGTATTLLMSPATIVLLLRHGIRCSVAHMAAVSVGAEVTVMDGGGVDVGRVVEQATLAGVAERVRREVLVIVPPPHTWDRVNVGVILGYADANQREATVASQNVASEVLGRLRIAQHRPGAEVSHLSEVQFLGTEVTVDQERCYVFFWAPTVVEHKLLVRQIFEIYRRRVWVYQVRQRRDWEGDARSSCVVRDRRAVCG